VLRSNGSAHACEVRFPVTDDRLTLDNDVFDSDRVLLRVFKRSLVDHSLRIKDDQIRQGAVFNRSITLEPKSFSGEG
jgi:hypothetical protein